MLLVLDGGDRGQRPLAFFFRRRDPKWVIAALELTATIVAIKRMAEGER